MASYTNAGGGSSKCKMGVRHWFSVKAEHLTAQHSAFPGPDPSKDLGT